MVATGGYGTGRKAIHVALSVGAAIVVYALEPTPAAAVLASATFVALVVELARRASSGFADAFRRRVGGMLKEREQGRLTGATTLAVGFTITAVLFPGSPALGAILLAGLGDPAAAVVGGRFGRVRHSGGKSLVGSATFLVVAAVVALALGLGPPSALLVAAGLTLVEALSLPIDDNLYLPPVAAAAFALAGMGGLGQLS